MTAPPLPAWAATMRDLFRSGSVSQFLLHGAVFDAIPAQGPQGPRLFSLKAFLDEVMFPQYDVTLLYDRSAGVRPLRGKDDWHEWLRATLGPDARTSSPLREPGPALELVDRYLLRALHLQQIPGSAAPKRIAVIIDFAEFVVPRGDALQLGGAFAANVVKVLGWANDPGILQSNIVTILLSEALHDLNDLVAENPHAAPLRIPLPDEAEMLAYLQTLVATDLPELPARSDAPIETVARRLTGLSRVGARRALSLALRNDNRVTQGWLTRVKKDQIERECQGLLEFLESPWTLDLVAGLDPVKAWLRQDAELLRRGRLAALPMGYLIAGRIGTGKTYLVECWAGELGLPCVVLKNFRDRWVGATESNLEKIFAVLRALGQAVVFVDEADQAAGKRGGGDGDSGLSGRVYSMLAKEMSDTKNRGRIIWVFATSRPDLLEVDLKRQGRLDVHIPLFPPETPEEVRALLAAIARKLKAPIADEDVPPMPDGLMLGGNELEGVLVRALRVRELGDPQPSMRDALAAALAEVRPNAHTRKLEYMDLAAVKECTDARFLPARFRDLTPEAIEARLDALRAFV